MSSVFDMQEHELNLLKGRVEELEAKVKTLTVTREEFEQLKAYAKAIASGYRTRLK